MKFATQNRLNILRLKIISIAFLLTLSKLACSQASYEEKVTTVSNVGATVSNLGIIGNSFKGSFAILNYPSFEYPVNSGIEHLFEGGLWVGVQSAGQSLVTTGCIDDATGYSTGKGGFEFSASPGSKLNTRSSLIDNPNYSPKAISHQDFFCDFSDSNRFVPGTTIPIAGHVNPLGIKVHYETYNWNYSFANFFVIVNMSITNASKNKYDSVYMGYWTDMVVRNVNVTPLGGTAFFNKGGNGYIDSLAMGYEFDPAGDTAFTRSYIGCMYLGSDDSRGNHHPKYEKDFKLHYNSWQFNNASDPILFFPSTDNGRYSKLSQGLNTNPNIDFKSILNSLRLAGNRSSMISVGPFKTLDPGQTINISFALVCAKMNEDGNSVTQDNPVQKKILAQNANWAQRTYNGEDVNFNGVLDPGEDRDRDGKITRFILPSPPNLPYLKFVPGDNKIDVYWADNSEQSVDPISNKKDFEGYRIYKTHFGFDVQGETDLLGNLERVAEFDKRGNNLFYNTGFDDIKLSTPVTFENDSVKYTYKYTINNIQNGWQHAIAITAFDEGDESNDLESLESTPLATMRRVFPGKPANNSIKTDQPFVYPNPYYAGAEWEGSRRYEEERKIYFSNLPARCVIKIYTTAGDLVQTIRHDPSYNGSDVRWFATNSDPTRTAFSGGEHAWDMLSDSRQIIARGIYIFTVENLDDNKQFKGRFVIVK